MSVGAFNDATDDFGFTALEDLGFVLEDSIVVESSTVDLFDLGVILGVFGVVAVVLSTTVSHRARDLRFDFVVVSFSDWMSLSLLNASDRLTLEPLRRAMKMYARIYPSEKNNSENGEEQSRTESRGTIPFCCNFDDGAISKY